MSNVEQFCKLFGTTCKVVLHPGTFISANRLTVSERVFIENGRPVRPFSECCEVKCRGYSLPLQRRITDFGADVPFGKVPEKFKEHCGISVPCSSVCNITEKHAEAVKDNESMKTEIPGEDRVEYIIAEYIRTEERTGSAGIGKCG